MTEISLMGHEKNNCQEKIESRCLAELSCSDELQNINCLYENAYTAENEKIKANQAEILCWRNFIIGLDNSIDEIMIKEKVGMKKAKGLIYDFIFAHNPDTKRKTLYQRISRVRKVYEFTEKIGIDKIKYIKTYGANSIAELSDNQIQTIIDYFSKNPNTELPDDQDGPIIDSEKEILNHQDNILEEQAKPLVSATQAEDDFDKMIMEAFEEEEVPQTTPAKANNVYDDVYFDDEDLKEEVNESGDENDSCDSEEEMPDDLDDDGYGGYNEYGECDRGYYYHDGRYERKTSPMMSPIISPVTT